MADESGTTGNLHLAPAEVPLEQLEREITALSGQIAAASAALLRWIAEYDRREGWATWDCRSAAHWLSWKCGDSLHTAREKVRVARALESLPLLAAAFAAGELSYSKVRAATRVATAANDDAWLSAARNATGAQLDRIVAGVAQALDDADAARDAFGSREVTVRSISSTAREVKVRAPEDAAATILAAIDVVASRQIDEAAAGGTSRRSVIAERGGLAAVRVDALVEIAERILAADPVAAQRGDVGRLALVVDAEALCEVAPDHVEPGDSERALGGRHVDREVARRIACDSRASVHLEHDGHGCDVGRETRIVNRRLRRALHRRDHGMCRHPGCGATSWLHAHHIVHWTDGGETELDNLISLCGFHHSRLHEGGFGIEIVEGAAVWTDPDGMPLTIEPLVGDLAQLAADHPRRPLPEPVVGNRRIDFPYVVSVLATHTWNTRPSGDALCDT